MVELEGLGAPGAEPGGTSVGRGQRLAAGWGCSRGQGRCVWSLSGIRIRGTRLHVSRGSLACGSGLLSRLAQKVDAGAERGVLEAGVPQPSSGGKGEVCRTGFYR